MTSFQSESMAILTFPMNIPNRMAVARQLPKAPAAGFPFGKGAAKRLDIQYNDCYVKYNERYMSGEEVTAMKATKHSPTGTLKQGECHDQQPRI